MSFVQRGTRVADDHVAGASPAGDPSGDSSGDPGGSSSSGDACSGDGGDGGHGGGGGPNGYKRASRKGAPKRFACPHEGCSSVYTRAEHLRRHQLNHNPSAHRYCDEPDCHHRSVRPDLLARHKERHARKRVSRADQSLNPPSGSNCDTDPASAAVVLTSPLDVTDASVLLTPESVSTPNVPLVVHQPPPPPPPPPSLPSVPPPHPYRPGWSAPTPQPPGPDEAGTALLDNGHGGDGKREPGGDAGQVLAASVNATNSEGGMMHEAQTVRDNLPMWLFGPAFDTAAQMPPGGPDDISETRRQEVLHWFGIFRQRKPAYECGLGSLVLERGGDLPGLSLDMMRDCMREFWDHVSPRMPIVHQHSFSCNGCWVFLLMIMVALGAASLRARETSATLAEYGAFADVIVSGLRWEVLPLATPPVELAAAQALLLLEFFETLYSAREFHERAHMYHGATVVLLRRGHPLVGRQDSAPRLDHSAEDGGAWWIRWARAESMNRAVFAAFMLDILKAAMFGHCSVMTPDDIRLPLPCMDALWTASSPDQARAMEASLAMCGVNNNNNNKVDFGDGLKRALHGEQVKAPAFGRMIIMAGLLNVGWHLKNRETQLGWLGLKQKSSSSDVGGDNWAMILRAFDRWKECLDRDPASELETRGCSNGLMRSPATLYHLAYMALHVSIVDIETYAGARRIMGRELNAADFAAAEARVAHWARQPAARSAILHSLELLLRILVDPAAGTRPSGGGGRHGLSTSSGSGGLATLAHAASGGDGNFVQYSLRHDPDPHRPFVVYFATLAVWAFACALGLMRQDGGQRRQHGRQQQYGAYARAAAFLGRAVAHGEAALGHGGFGEGVRDLVGVVGGILGEAHSGVLREGSERLKHCEDMCRR